MEKGICLPCNNKPGSNPSCGMHGNGSGFRMAGTNIDSLMKQYGFKYLYLRPILPFERERFLQEYCLDETTCPPDHIWFVELSWGSGGECNDNHKDSAVCATGKTPDDAIKNATESEEWTDLWGQVRYDFEHLVECKGCDRKR